ncbi:DUF58 domain-containing protein [Microbacterium sp. NPDC078428]|uniref:DUF58 domain-containing protein n=1 Tax=Microbacterium limosum TaxID=3079935 RepID=A0AAU0MFR9_9MICO|nr:DUF58 domain-containing protein [Microbacterium sp. Y20]WOQ69323.1 DUF58 domain-containing protein [Microbacterium sp. Y20]
MSSTEPGRTGTASASHTRLTTAARSGRTVALVAGAARVWRAARERGMTLAERAAESVTPAGWLVIAAGSAGLVTGAILGWVEWIVAGIASAVMLALALPFLFGARAYDVEVFLDHERVVAGGVVGGEIRIRNRGRSTQLPGRLDLPVGDGLVELGVPLLRADHVVAQPLTLPAERRGIITVGPPTTVRSDPIGLVRREHAWDDVHRLYVHPRTVSVPSTSAGLIRDLEGNPTRRLVEADMSFHAIREYAPGDTRRQIHWKSTAKTGQLMVRQFEESRRSRMAIVLGLAAAEFADADEFELAVSAAASLGTRAIRDGRDLDVVIGAEIPRAVRGRLQAVRDLTAASPRALLDGFCAVRTLEETMPVEGVCRLTAETKTTLSIAIIVCGSQVTPSRLRRAALAFPADTAVLVIRCDERAHPRVQTPGGMGVLTIGVLDDLASLMLRGAA